MRDRGSRQVETTQECRELTRITMKKQNNFSSYKERLIMIKTIMP